MTPSPLPHKVYNDICIECNRDMARYCQSCMANHMKEARAFPVLVEALKNILDYGNALQPGPVHHVTFNACVIAKEALEKAGIK